MKILAIALGLLFLSTPVFAVEVFTTESAREAIALLKNKPDRSKQETIRLKRAIRYLANSWANMDQ